MSVRRESGDRVRIGIHVSIAGGFEKVAPRAKSLGCESAQIFSRSPRGGKARDIEPGEASAVRNGLREAGIRPLVVHVPYFVNLASSDDATRAYTTEVIALDIMRAAMLGASYVVTHLGNASGRERGAKALDGVVLSILDVFRLVADSGASLPSAEMPMLLLENQAGKGAEMGCSFEEIGEVAGRVAEAGFGQSLGICLDTCHAFSAGYDLRTEQGWGLALKAVDEALGIDRLKVIHANDSRDELGSGRDRHEHIGLGRIGEAGFLAMFRATLHAGIEETACILETPSKEPQDDPRNVQELMRLRDAALEELHR